MTNITLNIMNYSKNYMDMFSSARYALCKELEHNYNFIKMCQAVSNPPSWLYFSMAADDLTAYNELSDCYFFVKMKHFKPNK